VALYECLRPVTRLWYARALGAGPIPPKPRDAPYIRSGEPGARRLLLLGNGPAAGWGTVSYQLALVGQLARAMTRAHGEPWDADYLGDEQLSASSARAWLGEQPLGDYTLVCVMIGMNDALRLTPVREWTARLSTLLGHLESGVERGTRILVTSIPTPSRSSPFMAPFGGVADRHALVLDEATERLVADFPAVSYLPLHAVIEGAQGSPRAYRELAEQIVSGLERTRMVHEQANVGVTDWQGRDWEWDAASHVVDVARSGGSVELQRITDEAKARFGVAMATVSIVDGDRLYYTVNSDRLPNAVPRDLTYCQVVVDEDSPLVVSNSKRDERFRDNPLLDVTHAPFYAGFPLHAADGHPVGALCLLDGFPKPERAVPLDVLEGFALRAQAELQRIEAEVRAERNATSGRLPV
jgi:GAF domain-containing protein